MPRVQLTAIVLTYNEQENIGPCLATLDWVDDVVIVDSGSTDATVENALNTRSDVRVFANPFEDFGQQRNWALANTAPQHDWVLFLDADERSTPRFEQAIARTLDSPGETIGFYLCCRNMFLGR